MCVKSSPVYLLLSGVDVVGVVAGFLSPPVIFFTTALRILILGRIFLTFLCSFLTGPPLVSVVCVVVVVVVSLPGAGAP